MKLFEACEGRWVPHDLRFNFFFHGWRKCWEKKEMFGKPAEIYLAWVRISRVGRARSPGAVWVRAAPCPSPKRSFPASGELCQLSSYRWAGPVEWLLVVGGLLTDTFRLPGRKCAGCFQSKCMGVLLLHQKEKASICNCVFILFQALNSVPNLHPSWLFNFQYSYYSSVLQKNGWIKMKLWLYSSAILLFVKLSSS